MTKAEIMQKEAEKLSQKYNRAKSTFHAVQRIGRWKQERYNHEFLQRWDKDYLGS